MKKLFTLFCLLALATVSYATSFVYDFEDGNNPFTDASRIESDIEYDETLASNVLGWTCSGNAQNGYSFSYFDFTDQLNHPEKVTVEFDYYNKSGGRSVLTIGDTNVRGTTGGSSKQTYNKTGAIFRIGSDKNNAFINDTQYGQGNLCDKWLHIVVTANIDAKTVEWVVTDKESTEISSGSDAFYADALSCTQIDMFGYINNSHCCMMDNLTITEYKGDAQYATYTIKYVDAYDNELKPSRSDEGKVGSYVTLYESDKANFYNDDESMKYIYTSDNTATEVIAAEGTVIKVVFREAETYAWTAKSFMGSQMGYTTSGETWEGEQVRVPYPRYQLLDGKLWEKPNINMEYNLYFDITENNQEFTFDYTETEIEDVVFLAEVEDVEGMIASNHGNAHPRCSQGGAGYSAEGAATLVGSLPLGKYRINARFFSPTNAGGEYTFTSSGRTIWTATTSNSNRTDMSSEVVLPHEDNSIQLGEGKFNVAVDYVYIQYIGQPTDEEIAEALAGEPNSGVYELYVVDTRVTSENADDILGDGTFSYAPESKTLTIHKSFTKTNAGILIDNHTVNGLVVSIPNDVTLDVYQGIYSHKDITITGPGHLTITSHGTVITDILDASTLTIKDITLDAECPEWGIAGEYHESLVIQNATINSKAPKGAICDFDGGITINGCQIEKPVGGKVLNGDIVDENGVLATEVTIVRDLLKGDVNADGKVDIADAVTVLNVMAGSPAAGNADVNADNKVDIADFVTVLNIMAGQ